MMREMTSTSSALSEMQCENVVLILTLSRSRKLREKPRKKSARKLRIKLEKILKRITQSLKAISRRRAVNLAKQTAAS